MVEFPSHDKVIMRLHFKFTFHVFTKRICKCNGPINGLCAVCSEICNRH